VEIGRIVEYCEKDYRVVKFMNQARSNATVFHTTQAANTAFMRHNSETRRDRHAYTAMPTATALAATSAVSGCLAAAISPRINGFAS
jgi:hypothetical protein